MKRRFISVLSLGLHQRADAEMAQHSAGWILNGKAVAHEVLAQRAILTAEGTDPTLADPGQAVCWPFAANWRP